MDAIVYDKVGKEAEKVRNALYGIYPKETITDAAIASFADGADGIPVEKLVVNIEPIQDLHGYDHPWAGGAGKNFADYSAEHSSSIGNTYTFNEYDGWIKEEWASGVQHQLVLSVPFVERLRGNKITISITSADISNQRMSDWRIFLLTYINGGSESIVATLNPATNLRSTITLNDNITEMRILLMMSQSGAQSLVAGDNIVFHGLQLEVSESPTSYAPYSNICPITGVDEVEVKRTGKNLFGGEANALFRLFIPSGTTVTASDLGGGNVRYYDAYQNEIDYLALINTESVSGRKYRSFTVSSDTYFVKFDVGSTTASDFQLEVGSALTSYEPYKGYTASLDLPATVYSGTLDLETGEVVADMASVDLGTLNWNKSTNYSTIRFLSTTQLVDAKKPYSNDYPIEAISSRYSIFGTNPLIESSGNGISVSDAGRISVKDSSLSVGTADAFKTAMSGVQLCYELATPKTYQLTVSEISGILTTLYGQNNIWSNTGNIKKLTYRADLGKYIDSHITIAVANTLNA